MKRVRITYIGKIATYSYIEKFSDEDFAELNPVAGEFDSTSDGVCGWMESLFQSDYCPYNFASGEDTVEKVKIEILDN